MFVDCLRREKLNGAFISNTFEYNIRSFFGRSEVKDCYSTTRAGSVQGVKAKLRHLERMIVPVNKSVAT